MSKQIDTIDVSVCEEIKAERLRQQRQEGWTTAHDDEHSSGELSVAACCYTYPRPLVVYEKHRVQLNSSRGSDPNCYFYDYANVEEAHDPWPFEEGHKRHKHPRRRQLIIAAALIVAEIERMDRAAIRAEKETA